MKAYDGDDSRSGWRKWKERVANYEQQIARLTTRLDFELQHTAALEKEVRSLNLKLKRFRK